MSEAVDPATCPHISERGTPSLVRHIYGDRVLTKQRIEYTCEACGRVVVETKFISDELKE